MRTETERVHFLCPLVVDSHLDGVLGEHIALQEEAVVRFEVVEYFFEGSLGGGTFDYYLSTCLFYCHFLIYKYDFFHSMSAELDLLLA